MHHDQRIVWPHSSIGEPLVHGDGGGSIFRHLGCIEFRIRRSNAERQQNIPLAHHRMARPQRAGSRNTYGVHPAAGDDVVADARRCAARPGEERAARASMKINREIVMPAPQSSNQRKIGAKSSRCVRAADDDHFVKVRVRADYGCGFFLDDIRDARVGIMSAESADGGSREHDVADEPQPDQQDVQARLFFDCRLVDKHNGNVVLDRIDPMARVAFEAGAVMHENDGGFAVRARKNFEEFSVERHEQRSSMGNAQNYSRKGTIETYMKRALLVALTLIAGTSAAFAQAKPAPAEPAGGAYYEFMIGLHLESQGDNAGASAAYQRAERLDPKSAEIPAALAELYVRMNRPTDAIAAGERAVNANPTNPEANWILGTLYARMADMPNTREPDRRSYMQRAIANLEKANRNAHPAVTIILSRLYIAERQYDKAIALLAPFVTEQPEQVEAVALLADAYQATDRDAEAITLLEQSVEESPELFSTLGQVYQDAGRWGDAARAYQGAVEQRPQNLSLRAQWATALLNAGDSQRAREVLEEGSAGSSRNSRALYLLSEAQRRTRDFAAAEVTARRLISLDSKALGGPRQLAQIFRDQREHQKIVVLLEPIITPRLKAADAADLTSDTFRSTYFDLATAYEALRQFDKAIALLTQARALSPTEPLVDIRLARSQQEAGKGEDAVRTLQAAVTRFPKEPGVMLSLGSALERDGKYKEAEGIFRQVIATDPTNADALNSLGYMFAERGQRLDEAVSLVERALAIEPENGAYLDSLGWAYYKQNRFEQAEKPLRDAAKQLPTVSVIQDHLGDVLNKRGLYQEAIDAWQMAIDGDGESISRSELDGKIKSARQRLGRKK
jgi:tetratricopeptide (TPR) repeat protein